MSGDDGLGIYFNDAIDDVSAYIYSNTQRSRLEQQKIHSYAEFLKSSNTIELIDLIKEFSFKIIIRI